jgi:hypothetical protein
LNPSPISIAAEAIADEQDLDAPIAGQARDRVLHRLELPGLDRDVVDEDGVQHDPADGEQAEGSAVDRARARHLPGHAVDEDRRRQRREEAQQRGLVRLDVEEGQRAEQHDHGQRGDESGKVKVPQRRVRLRPRHRHFPRSGWKRALQEVRHRALAADPGLRSATRAIPDSTPRRFCERGQSLHRFAHGSRVAIRRSMARTQPPQSLPAPHRRATSSAERAPPWMAESISPSVRAWQTQRITDRLRF